ncbi:pre-mRNA splicing factor affecting 3 splice site choice [Scheffersomyces coipomensis]|uniref:pre-mRNA splicing factor affecting 3 splice site choice n=1 Tax=Scheffersomyces coipomensis TaxID=1788519 RepID=UPI00315E00AF
MSSKNKDKEVKPKPRYRSDLKPGDINPYIPKYISEKPWYQETSSTESDLKKQKLDHQDEVEVNEDQQQPKEDYLSHQRKNKDVIVDYSLPTSGSGINDEFIVQNNVYIKKIDDNDNDNNNNNNTNTTTDKNNDRNIYDIKRDRWYGYNNKEWDKIFQNWEKIKQKSKKIKRKISNQNKDDESDSVSSDDTDYELELIELNLQRKDISTNNKQNHLEKMIRDREDIPSYIYNISSDPNNKIRIDYDPKSRLAKNLEKGFLNDKNQFVKKLNGEGKDLIDLQKFAWEIDQNDLKDKQKQQLINKLSTEATNDYNDDDNITETNLDFSLEASPTLMMLKAKEKQEENKRVQLLKKKALLDKYGSSSN